MDHRHKEVIQNPFENSATTEDSKTFSRHTPLSPELEATLERLTNAEVGPEVRLAENLSTGTFAQRARAAELHAARTIRETRTRSGDFLPLPHQVRERPKALKMPRRQKWAPLDLTSEPEIATETVATPGSFGAQPIQTSLSPLQQMQFAQQIHDFDAVPQTQERETTNNPSHYFSTLHSSFPRSTIPVSANQSYDLAEYPPELQARILADPSFKPLLHTFFPNESRQSTESTAQVGNAQAPGQNNQAYRQQANTRFGNTGFQARNIDSQKLAEEFARIQFASHPGIQFASDFQHRSTQPASHAMNAGINLSFDRGLPAVKGTRTAAEKPTFTLPTSQPNLQNPLPQHYSTLPPQNLQEVLRKSWEREREYVADQLHTDINTFNRSSSGQAYQRSHPRSHGQQEFRGTASQMRNIGRFTQLKAGAPVDKYNVRFPIPSTDDCDIARARAIDWGIKKFESQLHNYVSNPFNAPQNLTRKQELEMLEKEVDEWWNRDNRFATGEMQLVEGLLARERAKKQNSNPFGTIGHKKEESKVVNNEEDKEDTKDPKPKGSEEENSDKEMVNDLLLPAMANLLSYKTGRNSANAFGPPPSWAIDLTPRGNESFFSQQWGQPPHRVGRDPRYRVMQHDDRISVFDDPTGRFPREEFSHDRSRGGMRRHIHF